MNEPIINFEADALTPSKGLFQERWDILKRNRRAYVSFWYSNCIPVGFSITLGKVFTQNIILFDPKDCTTCQKNFFLRSPLSPVLSLPKKMLPTVGIYLIGYG